MPQRSSSCGARRAGVSLTEVLTVCAIVAFMLALLVPSLSRAREQARRAHCANNLRQWGQALHYYRTDHPDFIPMEGTTLGSNNTTKTGGIYTPGTWFNELPRYLDLPAYRDIRGVNVDINDYKNFHVWICPAKTLTELHKSGTGKNQFHYGMNEVLDGIGKAPAGSDDAPGFPDPPQARPVAAERFRKHPNTVVFFEILSNQPRGSPRDVATELARGFNGEFLGRFHGDYANFLYLSGGVAGFSTADLVADNDLRYGAINWHHPALYWGYPPPEWQKR
ncbi:MAG: type II secretion system protein [Planctomycetes bacterium]|nr:type II secretion system protein [Planctomycetota bacterium]